LKVPAEQVDGGLQSYLINAIITSKVRYELRRKSPEAKPNQQPGAQGATREKGTKRSPRQYQGAGPACAMTTGRLRGTGEVMNHLGAEDPASATTTR